MCAAISNTTKDDIEKIYSNLQEVLNVTAEQTVVSLVCSLLNTMIQ